jgi:SOS-response transcriptional repressor LexA
MEAKMGDGIDDAPVQQRLLKVILGIWNNSSRVPTYQEIADSQKMAKSGVQNALTRLIAKHYLECEWTACENVRTGTIRPTRKAFEWWRKTYGSSASASAPMLTEESAVQPTYVIGDVAAGKILLVNEDAPGDREHVPLPSERVRRAGIFMLRVTGESMSGDDLHTGDHLIVDPNARCRDGDMVIVDDQGSPRVKRFWDDGSHIILESSNWEYEPIKLEKSKEQLAGPIIEGKVIGRVLWHVKPGRRNRQL